MTGIFQTITKEMNTKQTKMLSVSLTPALVFRPTCAMRVNGGGLEPSAITLGMAPTQTK